MTNEEKKEGEYFTCKRRIEDGADSDVFTFGGTGKDFWYRRDGVLTCSYDGGIKPSEVIRLIESGDATDLESTDKYYKFYLHVGKQTFKIYMQHNDKESFDAMVAAAKKRDILNAWKKNFQKPV